jgi:hypothetical protein
MEKQCAGQVSLKAINRFHEVDCKAIIFKNLKAIFAPCFKEIAEEIKLSFDPDDAVDIFLSEHGNLVLYQDSLKFLEGIKGQTPVCLISDADHVMIQPLLERFEFDKVFISEAVGAYKNNAESRMFRQVLAAYQLQPDIFLQSFLYLPFMPRCRWCLDIGGWGRILPWDRLCFSFYAAGFILGIAAEPLMRAIGAKKERV